MSDQTKNRITLGFEPAAAETTQTPNPFVFSFANNTQGISGFALSWDMQARRRELEGEQEDIERRLEREGLEAFWLQFFTWLQGTSNNFDKFFANPAQNFADVGITSEGAADTFNAASAFAGGYILKDFPVGRDKLTIEPKTITVDTGDEQGFPEAGIMAAIALALKNPAFNVEAGVTIDAEDDELLAFTYAAMKAAKIKIKNEGEILEKLGDSLATNTGTLEWAKIADSAAFKQGLENFPELKARLETSAEAEEIDLDEQPTATDQTPLAAAVASLQGYTAPDGVKSYEFYNTLTLLKKEDFKAIEEGSFQDDINDMRASAITGLLRGTDKQQNVIVGQILMRALQAAVKHTTAPVVEGVEGKESDNDHFHKFLLSKGVEQERAAELAATLHEPLKAAIDALPDTEVTDRGKTIKFKNLHELPEDIKAALVLLVESQHNPISGIKESFVGAGEVVERLLADENFINKASPMIAGDFVSPDVGVIAERVFGYTLKTDHVQTNTDGSTASAPSKVDVPNEVGQAWIALYRIFAKPEAALASAKITDTLQHAPFSVNPQTNMRQDFVLQEAATAQYAALLIRSIGESFKLGNPDRADFQTACTNIVYGCAQNALRVIDDYTPPEGQDETFTQGLNAMRAQLQNLSDIADGGITSNFDKKMASSGPVAAKALGEEIVAIEKLYLKAANAAGVPDTTLKANLDKLATWRKSTVASFAAANFANKADDVPEAAPEARGPNGGLNPQ